MTGSKSPIQRNSSGFQADHIGESDHQVDDDVTGKTGETNAYEKCVLKKHRKVWGARM
ncbi:MAG: hypothetical protein Ct9H90mP8_3780 [Pseudomonadota bacterium]|nr:MAG: hypothetical protein Ct9H90mP8_3780 [Pseudomonadota bacterium]